jgi:8-amino-7-oxononanoate synthase
VGGALDLAGRRWLRRLGERLSEHERRGLRRHRPTLHWHSPTELTKHGQRLVQFASNDYLSLSWRLAHAPPAASPHESSQACPERLPAESPTKSPQPSAGEVSERIGSGASPLITGRGAAHAELEQALADWTGTGGALTFSSGFQANVSVLPALVEPGDLLLSDQLNHASLIDGCRLTRARRHVYPHADVGAVERLLRQHRHGGGGAWIVTDSLFSMHGDLAPLAELADLAERYDCQLIVDEAHASGVYGESGAGLAEQLGVQQRIDVHLGTLSKAIGGVGGFAAGDLTMIEWLVQAARGYIYSTAMPPSTAAAAVDSLQTLIGLDAQRQRLRRRAARLRTELTAAGWRTLAGDSPIVPIFTETLEQGERLSQSLLDCGLLVPFIRPPTVPEPLMRISLNVSHTEPQLGRLIESLVHFRSTA